MWPLTLERQLGRSIWTILEAEHYQNVMWWHQWIGCYHLKLNYWVTIFEFIYWIIVLCHLHFAIIPWPMIYPWNLQIQTVIQAICWASLEWLQILVCKLIPHNLIPSSVFPQFSCGCLYRLVQACTSSKSWKSARTTSYVRFPTSLVSFRATSSHRLTTYYPHDQKFIYILPKHGSRPWASICLLLLLSSSLATTTFLRLCCVQQPKQNSELAVLADKCLEPICKSCSKLRSPYGFIILRFGKNGTLVSLSATGKAKKAESFLSFCWWSFEFIQTLLFLGDSNY